MMHANTQADEVAGLNTSLGAPVVAEQTATTTRQQAPSTRKEIAGLNTSLGAPVVAEQMATTTRQQAPSTRKAPQACKLCLPCFTSAHIHKQAARNSKVAGAMD